VSLAYFDTGALVKNYLREAGSSRVHALLSRYEFLSSAITPIELQSAVQRRHRQREISQANYNAIISRVTNDRSCWQLVEIVPQVLSKAEKLVNRKCSNPGCHSYRVCDAHPRFPSDTCAVYQRG